MAANHRIINIKRSADGTFHYHIKRGRNILLSARGYNDKRSIVKTAGHLFGLTDLQKKVLGYYNTLNMDVWQQLLPIVPEKKKSQEPDTSEPVPRTDG